MLWFVWSRGFTQAVSVGPPDCQYSTSVVAALVVFHVIRALVTRSSDAATFDSPLGGAADGVNTMVGSKNVASWLLVAPPRLITKSSVAPAVTGTAVRNHPAVL